LFSQSHLGHLTRQYRHPGLKEVVNERLKMYGRNLKENYIKFRETWNCASQSAQKYGFNLPVFDISVDVSKFDSMEAVEEELVSITNKCNSIEELPYVPGGENKAQLLSSFVNYLEKLKHHFIKAFEEKQQLKLYIESLGDDGYVPDADMLTQKIRELEQAEREKKELEDRQNKLQKLEKYYRTEDEKEQYGLLEVLV